MKCANVIVLGGNMKKKIAVIGGDGTGPEVVAEGLKTLRVIASIYNLSLDFYDVPLNGKRYL